MFDVYRNFSAYKPLQRIRSPQFLNKIALRSCIGRMQQIKHNWTLKVGLGSGKKPFAFYCSGKTKRHNHCKFNSHLILRSRETREILLLRIRAEKGQDDFIEQGRMRTDIKSQSEWEEFTELLSAVISALMKALMTALFLMLTSRS